jgi:TPR repeat protein
MVSLATAYYSGSFDGINDFEKARYWYRKAADAGSDLGQFYLGVVYEKEGDVENAEKWIKLAAANGNKTAQKHIIIKKEKQEVND